MATSTCSLSSGIGFTCANLTDLPGGFEQLAYIGNIGDLDTTQGDDGFTIDSNGYVTDIHFTTYKGLYRFTAVRYGHTTNSDIQRVDGGNPFFPQSVTMKLVDVTPEQKSTLEDLARATVFVIVQSSTGRFEIYGRKLGLEIESGVKAGGNRPEDVATREITLSGTEPELEKIFFNLSKANSATVLETYTVS